MTEDNLTNFLSNPTEESLLLVEDKAEAIQELNKQQETSKALLFKWKRAKRDIRAIDIIRLSVKENNLAIPIELVHFFNDIKFTKEVAYILAKAGKDISFIVEKNTINHEWLAYCAAITGDSRLLNDLLKGFQNKDGVTNYLQIAKGAAEGGHKEIVFSMISSVKNKSSDVVGIINYDYIAKGAAEGGHREIIMDMIKLGAKNINWIAEYAARGGHREIVMDMLAGVKDRDGNIMIANDYNLIACGAIMNNDMVLLDEMFRYNVNRLFVAIYAARYGLRELVNTMIKTHNHRLLTRDYNEIAKSAARGGYIDIVKAMNDGFKNKDGNIVGADNYKVEVKEDYDPIMDIITFKGVKNNSIASKAAAGGHKGMIEVMINEGHNVDINKLDFGPHIDCKLYFILTK